MLQWSFRLKFLKIISSPCPLDKGEQTFVLTDISFHLLLFALILKQKSETFAPVLKQKTEDFAPILKQFPIFVLING